MLKKLFFAAAAVFTLSASAATTTVYSTEQDFTAVDGSGDWWAAPNPSPSIPAFDCEAGDDLVFNISDKADNIVIQPIFGGWNTPEADRIAVPSYSNGDRYTITDKSITMTLTAEEAALASKSGLVIQAGGFKLLSIDVVSPDSGVTYTEYNFTKDGDHIFFNGNAEIAEIADDVKVVITLKITKGEGVSTEPGWGVGTLGGLGVYNGDAPNYSFTCKSISEEGALNEYKFTMGELRAIAKGGTDEWVHPDWGPDSYGLTFNLWGGATFVSAIAYIPETSAVKAIEAVDENAPVEYYDLNGVRVANPENGIFIRRQGNKVTKVAK